MASQKVSIQQHDKNIKVFFNITVDGIVEPILGSTVYFKFMNRASGTTYIRTCDITDAELGECCYTFTEEDTGEVGNYVTELEINFENGTRLSVDNPISLTITSETICHHREQYGRSIRMF